MNDRPQPSQGIRSRAVPKLGRVLPAAVLAGCAVLIGPAPGEPANAAPAVAQTEARAGAAADLTTVTPQLRRSFKRLSRASGGRIGVSWGAVGSKRRARLGNLRSGTAWSTAKVPLAVALSRQNGGRPTRAMRRAIKASDNEAADAIWRQLGSGSRAGRKVNRVLRSAGDPTKIRTRRSRGDYSPFGQTRWALIRQQRFAAQLPCIAGSKPVLQLMGQVVKRQRWGLGRLRSARFKGGWGPEADGGQLVRQMGVVRVRGGRLAVAIAARPRDGSYAAAVADLDRIARWIRKNLRGGPVQC